MDTFIQSCRVERRKPYHLNFVRKVKVGPSLIVFTSMKALSFFKKNAFHIKSSSRS